MLPFCSAASVWKDIFLAQEKQTTAESRKNKRWATCSWWTTSEPHGSCSSRLLVQRPDQADSSHHSPHMHAFIWLYVIPWKSSQLLFYCKKEDRNSTFGWTNCHMRREIYCGGRAAGEDLTFSFHRLTNLFLSVWSNMAHCSFLGFEPASSLHYTICSFSAINPAWLRLDACGITL